MGNIVILGAQWGDEGKGKLVDLLADRFDYIIRYQGGHNAGHTILIGDRKFVLRLVPSGILHPGKIAVIGNGLVVDPLALDEEVKQLIEAGIDVPNQLRISNRAHVVIPTHRLVEKITEANSSKTPIGTLSAEWVLVTRTRRGAGGFELPTCWTGSTSPITCARRWKIIANERGPLVSMRTSISRRSSEGIAARRSRSGLWSAIRRTCSPRPCARVRTFCLRALRVPCSIWITEHILFVTSSSACAGGACTGTGVPPTKIDTVIGISKAYITRVGGGPFPTEALDQRGDQIRNRGKEFGSVTGRPRRCGWFDVPLLRYSAVLNGFDTMVITKLDVLDELNEIPVCVGYKVDGITRTEMPATVRELATAIPVYETLPGWMSSTEGISVWEKLPGAARDYILFLEQQTGLEAGCISTGPERNQTVRRANSNFSALTS